MMIAHEKRPMIAWPPPQAATTNLEGNIKKCQLAVEFLEVRVMVVLGRPDAQRMRVADVVGINAQRERIGQFDPATEVRLNLLAVPIVLAHPILAEPHAPVTD